MSYSEIDRTISGGGSTAAASSGGAEGANELFELFTHEWYGGGGLVLVVGMLVYIRVPRRFVLRPTSIIITWRFCFDFGKFTPTSQSWIVRPRIVRLPAKRNTKNKRKKSIGGLFRESGGGVRLCKRVSAVCPRSRLR